MPVLAPPLPRLCCQEPSVTSQCRLPLAQIHEHILLHGDIRKKTKIKVAGEEMEVETLMAEEDEDTVKKPTAEYANRESFLIMRDRWAGATAGSVAACGFVDTG